MNFDSSSSSFTRLGSFRQATITERLQDPQVWIFDWWRFLHQKEFIASLNTYQLGIYEWYMIFQVLKPSPKEPPVEKEKVSNPYAIARPHATDLMYQRQTSFKGLGQLNQVSIGISCFWSFKYAKVNWYDVIRYININNQNSPF